MAFPKVHKLFDAETTLATSAVVNTRRFRNKRGILFSDYNRGGRFDYELQVSADLVNWATESQLDETDHPGARAVYSEAVYHFPFIRLVITNIDVGVELTAYYIQ